jgi:2-C-methyl-D-erythritol 2,4-cyclodiphosphate synthase
MKNNIRIGFGFDIHRLEDGDLLALGGVKIPSSKSAVAHSDGDVLIHAICDALLGAANLRDIGNQFPDTDMAFKGIDSKLLLEKTMKLVREKGYEIGNIDATICLEKPRINPHVDAMKAALAKAMNIETDSISIKATTNERLGYIGREEGVTAYAVVLLYKEER